MPPRSYAPGLVLSNRRRRRWRPGRPIAPGAFEIWPAKGRERTVAFTTYQDGSPTKKGIVVIFPTELMKVPTAQVEQRRLDRFGLESCILWSASLKTLTGIVGGCEHALEGCVSGY